jgi:hypothetical protein
MLQLAQSLGRSLDEEFLQRPVPAIDLAAGLWMEMLKVVEAVQSERRATRPYRILTLVAVMTGAAISGVDAKAGVVPNE